MPLFVAATSDYESALGFCQPGAPRPTTAAVPMENSYCSYELTSHGLQLQSLWRIPTAANNPCGESLLQLQANNLCGESLLQL